MTNPDFYISPYPTQKKCKSGAIAETLVVSMIALGVIIWLILFIF